MRIKNLYRYKFITLIGCIICVLNSVSGAENGWQSCADLSFEKGFTLNLINPEAGRDIPVMLGSRVIKFKAGNKIISLDYIKLLQSKTALHKIISPLHKVFGDNKYFKNEMVVKKISEWQYSVKYSITALSSPLKFTSFYCNFYAINSSLVAGYNVDIDTRNYVISKVPLGLYSRNDALKDYPAFEHISFDSLIGEIEINFTPSIHLIDGRKANWYKLKAHLFGNEFTINRGDTYTISMNIKIKPDFRKLTAFNGKIYPDYHISNPQKDRWIIVPAPKNIKWSAKQYLLKNNAIVASNSKNDHTLRYFKKQFNTIAGIKLQTAEEQLAGKNPVVVITSDLAAFSSTTLLKQQADKLRQINQPQSYIMDITAKGIVISGNDEQGLWNGVMTLLQVTRKQRTFGNAVRYNQVSIADFPAFKHRHATVRLDIDTDYDYIKKSVDVYAQWKYDTIFLAIRAVNFPSLPAFSRIPKAVTPEKLKELADYIRMRNMEVIPIWHCGKTLFTKSIKNKKAFFKQHKALRNITMPGNSNFYDISVKQTYLFHQAVLDVILKVTQSSKINITMDEIMHFSKNIRNNKGQGALVLSDYINAFTDNLSKRGITTIVYGDMMVKKGTFVSINYHPANASGGSENALSLLRNRKKLMIQAWDYANDNKYPPFDALHKTGIKTFGSSWYNRVNIVGYAKYTKGRTDTYGLLYFGRTNRSTNRVWDFRGWRQLGKSRFPGDLFVPAFCLGAEATWNGDDEKLNYNYLNEALETFNGRELLPVNPEKCVPINLDPYCNTSICDNLANDGKGFTDMGPNQDLSSFPTGNITLQGIPFQISKDKINQGRAILVSGKDSNKAEVDIMLGKAFSKLIFLQTCDFDVTLPPSLDLLARYKIEYQDGTKEVLSLRHDKTIIAWSPALTRLDAENTRLWVAWTGVTLGGESIAIYAYEWKNPKPDKIIKRITLSADKESQFQVFLFGLTGIK